MKNIATLFSVLFLIVACEKEKIDTKEAKVVVSVRDESGNVLVNVPVGMYDERGYELFKKDNLTLPALVNKTDSKGVAIFIFPQEKWFIKQTQRFFAFVVMEGGGPDNYQIWSARKTVEEGKTVEIEIRLTEFPSEDLSEFDNTGIEEAEIKAITPPLAVFDLMWYGFKGTAVIRVPGKAVEQYKTAKGWNEFADKIIAL